MGKIRYIHKKCKASADALQGVKLGRGSNQACGVSWWMQPPSFRSIKCEKTSEAWLTDEWTSPFQNPPPTPLTRGQNLNTTMSTLLKIESCHDANFEWYYGIYSMLLPRNSTPVVLSNYTHTYILPFLPHRHLQWGVTYMTWAFQ